MIDEARRRDRRLALLYVDLDSLKDAKDTRGHAAGDALLQQVAARIAAELEPGQTVARMAGTEFAILQAGADAMQARTLGERVIASLGGSFEVDGSPAFVGASVGITLVPDDADGVALLHRNADLALYRAKDEGRNRCHFFDDELNQQVQRRASVEQKLREPTLPAQLHLAFQPQVELVRGEVTGAAPPLRWRHNFSERWKAVEDDPQAQFDIVVEGLRGRKAG